jgi:hypothetical protein
MKKLFESWRKFEIKEGMRTPDQLPDDVYVLINTEEEDDVVFSYVNRAGNMIKDGEGPVHGFVEVKREDGIGGCLGAWSVNFSNTSKGWGPLLYDVAIEWCTMRGNGLMPDRMGVSNKAYAVWEKYMQRSDVEKVQLDSLHNELTPEEFDNCMQSSSDMHAQDRNIHWKDTATAKVYRKKTPQMINKLDKLGKLVFKDVDLYEDKIPGGLADDMSEKDFDKESLRKGIKVELEHTDDYQIAKEIAMDHLSEDPKYYDKLATIEKH